MEALLNDVALLTKLEKERGELLREEVDAAGIAASLVDSLRDMAEARHISLTAEMPSSISAVGNPVALRQILINLISNAIKYNRDQGTVRITCEAAGDKVVLSVIDTGPGIVKEELENVFNKFYRARSSEGVSGSGLGLYIAKLLAEAMGGRLVVTSSLREGSTFSLFLERPASRKDDREDDVTRTGGALRRV
jgi:signal transduction histidine kinase